VWPPQIPSFHPQSRRARPTDTLIKLNPRSREKYTQFPPQAAEGTYSNRRLGIVELLVLLSLSRVFASIYLFILTMTVFAMRMMGSANSHSRYCYTHSTKLQLPDLSSQNRRHPNNHKD
jgi:hypothetical protein